MKSICSLFAFILCLNFSHAQTWQYMDSLRQYYQNKQSYDTALVYAHKALQSAEEKVGENDTLYADMLVGIIECYYYNGQSADAVQYSKKECMIRKNIQGENNPNYAASLCNLASLYMNMGDFSAAEPVLTEARNIYKEVLGEKHPYYSTTLNNLAALYRDMGNYTAAEPLLIEAKEIYKEVLGEKHPYYAFALNNLALLYKETNNLGLAESLMIETIHIREEIMGKKHPEYAKSLNNLALIYEANQRFGEAIPLLQEAISIYKEVLGDNHPSYATSLDNLAVIYLKTGKYSEAEQLFMEAKNIYEKAYGGKQPFIISSTFKMANVYRLMDNNIKSEAFYCEGLEKLNSAIIQNFSFLSEKEKEMYFKKQSVFYADFYAFALKNKSDNPEITSRVFNNVIKNKGLLLKSSTAIRTSVLNSGDTVLLAKFDNWVRLKKKISKLYSVEISRRKENPESIENQANTLEKELALGSQRFSDFEKMQTLTWENVKNSLKPCEAAVEFICFTDRNKNDSTFYCALLITPQSSHPEMIFLFEENEIMAIIDSSGSNDFCLINNVYGTNKKTNLSLYRLIWQPLEPYLSGINTIYFSPDGILYKISFAAIGREINNYLCDKYILRRVSSTIKIASDCLYQKPANNCIDETITACLFGGIDYSADSSANIIWEYLPGTLSEIDAINENFVNKNIPVSLFKGKQATESNFMNIFIDEKTSPEILHIATHGFFYPDPELNANKEKTKVTDDAGKVFFRGSYSGFGLWQFVKNKNPLMRSGLVLAGANKIWNRKYAGEGEDGVLTALEVSQMNLLKTDLVVLSACETGLGDIRGSEGVYGLQRAFKMAGVKYIIMSLWQVPDKETVEFMETFYKKLLKEKDVRQAFNETQKEMRKKYDPYFWGAFVLIE